MKTFLSLLLFINFIPHYMLGMDKNIKEFLLSIDLKNKNNRKIVFYCAQIAYRFKNKHNQVAPTKKKPRPKL